MIEENENQAIHEDKTPLDETEEALKNSRNRENLTTYEDSDELFEDLGI